MKPDMYLLILRNILLEALFLPFRMLSMQPLSWLAEMVLWRNFIYASTRISRLDSYVKSPLDPAILKIIKVTTLVVDQGVEPSCCGSLALYILSAYFSILFEACVAGISFD
jgi:hypothetical protein